MPDGRSASPPVKEREFTAAATFIAAPDLDCPLGSRITLPDSTWLVLAVAQQTPAPIGTDASGWHEQQRRGAGSNSRLASRQR